MVNLEINNLTASRIPGALLKKSAKKTIKELKIRKDTEISLVFVGAGRMKRLNKFWRGKNRVTDVLAFNLNQANKIKKNKFLPEENFIGPLDNVLRLGEIIICLPVAKKQAKIREYSLDRELTVLLIHGILHLGGYDHEKSEKEEKKMMEKQEEILSKLKI